MADDEDLNPEDDADEPLGSDGSAIITPFKAPDPPLIAYQGAIERYEGIRRHEILADLGFHDPTTRPNAMAGIITDRLGDPRLVDRLLARLDDGARLALSLFAVSESTSWPLNGLDHALRCLGVDPAPALHPLLNLGLVALDITDGPLPLAPDLDRLANERRGDEVQIRAHPVVVGGSRTALPAGGFELRVTAPRNIREADGLEPILRLGALWQRVGEAPLRRTQQGTLYKRDRDRLEEDPVLAGPIADVLEPMPDMAALWLVLARAVGLLHDDPQSDRILAAPPVYWAENAFHLPQMIATRWLSLRTWHEQAGLLKEDSDVELALPDARAAILLWLATLGDDEWVALDDFANHLRRVNPTWDRMTHAGEPASPPKAPARGKPPRPRGDRKESEPPSDATILESLLLGSAYQMGLVRVGEEAATARKVAQLTPLGRYILALGPPPPPRPTFEHFLFVQPNFEIIAYRQGLTPALVGQLCRFTHWIQVGAALETKLTPESVYRGLEGGLEPQGMLDRLSRHSPRPLPAGVAEAVRTWAGRRDRVSFYASATLVEFATHADREQAIALWPATAKVAPVPISDRLLLVEDEASIPYQRFRLAGARDYRRAPEACLEVEADGIAMTLDLGRSDLLVDAELARFADEQPLDPARDTPGNPKRRFLVTPASMARAAENGLTLALLSHWYLRRTGDEIPPAVRLLLLATDTKVPPLSTSRPLILHSPTSLLLDGLLQHPETRPYLGARLGPTSVIISEEILESFRKVLGGLGLSLTDTPPDPTPESTPRPPNRKR